MKKKEDSKNSNKLKDEVFEKQMLDEEDDDDIDLSQFDEELANYDDVDEDDDCGKGDDCVEDDANQYTEDKQDESNKSTDCIDESEADESKTAESETAESETDESKVDESKLEESKIAELEIDDSENDDSKTDIPGSKHKIKIKTVIYDAILVICVIVFIVCAYKLGKYYLDANKTQDEYSKLSDMVKEDSNLGDEKDPYTVIDGIKVQNKFARIYEENTDLIGWLNVPNTKIDYPVMQTPNEEEYYLRKNFYKEYEISGTLFMDTSSSITPYTSNLLIYGHNMKTGIMFHDLLKYEDEEFYKDNPYIEFDTIYEDGKYEIIGAFYTQIYEVDDPTFKYYQFFQANSEEEFDNYVSNVKNLTTYETNADAKYGDVLLTLSTCAYHVENGRFVVVAKKVN